ncbi:MAG TPA: cbb3-type cytochrome c oxidase subunit II [Candidatus Paceibacterota bacterium]|nr:cbb3-type cytochrome c oxidase subunit II [Verrucomicrobiota bacterium]HSA09241.1 cbb3-type cytochrome c oxidase subunit II [Candidatus Paceibacterota bacterium]
MNRGPVIFLAAFFALASSWCGFILAPQLQIGRLQQTNTLGAAVAYPVARPGAAQQGLQVYRANGCAYCHSQQAGQTGTVLDVALAEAGTNQAATMAALLNLAGTTPALTALPGLESGRADPTGGARLQDLPKAVLRSTTRGAANAAVKTLNSTGAKAQLWVVPVGPDITRGWGRRRSVAEDFLFDSPVMPGSQRVGPDLANVGARLPDSNWHLRHLYAPQLEVSGSTMPPYRFLFEQRRVRVEPSPEALVLPAELAPPPGYEVVPKPAAKALVAYLSSLRADAALFGAPLTQLGAAGAPNATNTPPAPGATPTNAVTRNVSL